MDKLSFSFVLGASVAAVATLVGGGYCIKLYRSRKSIHDEKYMKSARLQNPTTRGSQVLQQFASVPIRKTYIVTGATSGLGAETAYQLCMSGARVVLAIRDIKVASELCQTWQTQKPGVLLECMFLDLSSLQSVKDFASKFLATGWKLDGLINNAGCFQISGVTNDGFQRVWQVNALSPFLLTELLLPSATHDFRVINVSSKLHGLLGSKSIAKLSPPAADGSTYFDYALSKATQILHAAALNVRFLAESQSDKNYKRLAFAIEPGLVKTKIMRESSAFMRWLNYLLLAPILKVS
jgi:retinol dehydrogenase-12